MARPTVEAEWPFDEAALITPGVNDSSAAKGSHERETEGILKGESRKTVEVV
jgi:hypothetical protein